jgi:tRNA (cytidine/uridine-2'-O-)-methyltransferase
MTIEIALFQPDIAANAGAMARLCACLGVKLIIIEPAGFAWDDSKLRRAGMDYLDIASIRRANSWSHFLHETQGQRKLLLTTKANLPYHAFAFKPGDILVMGQESAGVPSDVHQACHERLTIPMQKGARSLNVGMACAMVAGEALRQTGGWPVTA